MRICFLHNALTITHSRAVFPLTFVRRHTMSTIHDQNGTRNSLEKVTVVGSGNWGSAIARIAAKNAMANPSVFNPKVTMWVFEEMFGNQPLSQLINKSKMNPKYLPGIDLGANVHAEPDLEKALDGATALIVVLPHQFLGGVLQRMKCHVQKGVRAVTLIKGVDVRRTKISTFASLIQNELGISCSALSGANIAHEVASDLFSESTLGVPLPPALESPQSFADALEASPEAKLWKTLFHTPTFRIRVVGDVEAVCLCGALKNIVALAAGFIDGLGWGANAKAAIMRQGLIELHDFCLEFFPSTRSDTFLKESCGVADVITSCTGGRNRKIAEQMVKTGKSFQELEKSMLNGQKLQGPQTAAEVHEFLHARAQEEVHTPTNGMNGSITSMTNVFAEKTAPRYPLFDAVWKICYEGMAPEKIIENL